MRLSDLRNPTIGSRLDETKGRTTGFDYLRVGLSAGVIFFHGFMTSYGTEYNKVIESGWIRPFVVFILPAFFALSGFLVTGSLLRSKTIWEFVTLRAVRLVPALFFEVLISALIIGPLLTAFTWHAYFTDGLFYGYWLNIVGEIHFRLPGLFLSNPDPDIVNRQLWTIPVELKCYAALTALYLVGASRHRSRMLALVAFCLVAFPAYDFSHNLDFDSFNNVPLKVLIECFLVGVVLYLYREKVPLNPLLAAACAALSYLLLLGKGSAYAACLPLAYATVAFGLSNTKANIVSRAGEYSYGLYIYGYVVQQVYAALFPAYRIWWMNVLVAFPVTLALGLASWLLVEKPALDRRKIVVDWVEQGVSGIRSGFLSLLRPQRAQAPK